MALLCMTSTLLGLLCLSGSRPSIIKYSDGAVYGGTLAVVIWMYYLSSKYLHHLFVQDDIIIYV